MTAQDAIFVATVLILAACAFLLSTEKTLKSSVTVVKRNEETRSLR